MSYLPPLDKCLTGRIPLIAWTDVLGEVTSNPNVGSQAEIQAFLSSEAAIALLSVPSFASPSTQSRQDYETRTAPIQTSSSVRDYNLDQFKNDSIWLSKELGIDEVAALRIVLVEWQSRPADLLLGRIFDETAQNGSKVTQKSSDLGDVPRHRRLLQVYMRENSAIKQLSAALLSLGCSEEDLRHEPWMLHLGADLDKRQSERGRSATIKAIIEDCAKQSQRLEDSKTWPESFQNDFALHSDFIAMTLSNLVSNVRQILAHLKQAEALVDASTILLWFHLMQGTNFLQALEPRTNDEATSLRQLQCLVSILSAALLDIQRAIPQIERMASNFQYPELSKQYIADNACVKELTLILYAVGEAGIQTAAPAIYAWSIILMYFRDLALAEQDQIEDQPRHGSLSRQLPLEQRYESIKDRALGMAEADPPQYLARQAVDGMDVYGIIAELSLSVSSTYFADIDLATTTICRADLLDIVRESLPTVTYDDHIIECVLALLSPEALLSQHIPPQPSLAIKFWEDRSKSQPLILHQALSRFPYELSPLLRLLSALSSNLSQGRVWEHIVEAFESLTTITMTLPEGFRGYALEHEEAGANAFHLTRQLPIFAENANSRSLDPPEGDTQMQRLESLSALQIAAGTQGTILRDSRPFIVILNHGYSGLQYIGLLLTTLLPMAQYTLASPAPAIDNNVGADIVQLMVSILRGATDRQSVEHIMDELKTNLSGQIDILAVVVELLDAELLARAEQTSQPGSLDLVIQCLRFLQAISPHMPERLWSYLAQSNMLDTSKSNIIFLQYESSSTDQTKSGQLLLECLRLYEISVEDALRGLVRRAKSSKSARSGSRFDSPIEAPGDISERVIAQSLAKFSSFALQITRGLTQRDGAGPSEPVECIVNTFTKILQSVYGTGNASSPMKVLRSAAEVVTAALVPDSETQPLVTLIASLAPLLQLDDKVTPAGLKIMLQKQVDSILQLVCVLLRTARLHDLPARRLATALLTTMPVLSSLFALQSACRGPIAELLTEVVTALKPQNSEAVSIFSQLSQQQGTQFLNLLTQFNSSAMASTSDSKIWRLFAAACRHSQQWFAMFLVTGVLPKDSIKNKSNGNTTALSHALDLLVDLKNMYPDRAAAMLEFVAEAQRTWTWATSIVRAHPDFITNVLAWLSGIAAPAERRNTADELLTAKEYRLAALVCDVLAVNIHASLELGDKSLLKTVTAKASFLANNAANVNAYNQNLHRTLNENLSKRFSGLKLEDLQWTTVTNTFGEDYMYNKGLAEILLGHDESWQGRQRMQGQGFLDELSRANANLNLYHAQMELLQNWKTLTIALAETDELDRECLQIFVDTIISSLSSSASANTNAPDSAAQLQVRADLIFSLLSGIMKSSVDQDTTTKILTATWTLVQQSPVNFDVAQSEQDLTYNRSLLQILFLALRLNNTSRIALAKAKPASTEGALGNVDLTYESLLIDIMSKTVVTSFRALCGNLHEGTDRALPSDFALVTGLAKTVIMGSDCKSFRRLLADAVAFSAVIRSSASLFSWSDRLADLTEDDPVYGEMAIMFLVTISGIPQVAEQMAVENVLGQLSSANISNYFRKPGGKGPFDSPSRMFAIWTDGILPLCLNLIEAVGPPVISEVGSLLNSFPEQLARAQKALQNASAGPRNPRAGAVTLSLLSEARDLITLAQIMTSAVELGAAEGIDSGDIQELPYNLFHIKDDLDSMTKGLRSLRDRVVPVTAREMALYNDKSGGSHDNALMAAVTNQITVISTMLG